jgi:Sec-independent protein translocase protein TatA
MSVELGPPEVALIAVLALLLFGKRVPEIARWIGRRFSK